MTITDRQITDIAREFAEEYGGMKSVKGYEEWT